MGSVIGWIAGRGVMQWLTAIVVAALVAMASALYLDLKSTHARMVRAEIERDNALDVVAIWTEAAELAQRQAVEASQAEADNDRVMQGVEAEIAAAVPDDGCASFGFLRQLRQLK